MGLSVLCNGWISRNDSTHYPSSDIIGYNRRMGHWFGRLTQIMGHSDTQAVEVVFSLLKLSWGVFLLLPIVSLGVGLRIFGFIVPEAVVGVWFTVIGAMQILGVLTLSLPYRTTSTLMALPTWLLLAGSIAVAAPRSVLWVLMVVLSLTNIWLYLRLKRRAL